MSRFAAGKLARLACLGVGLAVSAQFVIVLLTTTRLGPDRHSDFVDYYVAAQLLRAGDSPYDPVAELRVRSAVSAAPDAGAVVFYFYPPPFLLLIVPFTFLSLWAANAVWTGIQLVAIWGGCVYLLARALKGWSRAFVLAWSLAWLPVVVNFKFGQISALLLLAFLGLADAIAHGKDTLAGFWAVVLGLKPALLLLPVVLFLYLRRSRALLTAVLLSVSATVVTVVTFGPKAFVGYRAAVRLAADLQASSELWRLSSYSFAVFTRGLGPFDWPVLIMLDLLAVGLWIRILRTHGPLDATSSMPAVALLINPHVFVYDLTTCLAAVPVLVRRPLKWSVPLVLTGFLLPWLTQLALRDPAAMVLWLALALAFVLGVPPDKNHLLGFQATADCVPSGSIARRDERQQLG